MRRKLKKEREEVCEDKDNAKNNDRKKNSKEEKRKSKSKRARGKRGPKKVAKKRVKHGQIDAPSKQIIDKHRHKEITAGNGQTRVEGEVFFRGSKPYVIKDGYVVSAFCSFLFAKL